VNKLTGVILKRLAEIILKGLLGFFVVFIFVVAIVCIGGVTVHLFSLGSTSDSQALKLCMRLVIGLASTAIISFFTVFFYYLGEGICDLYNERKKSHEILG
jgi:hypothetical protein